MTPAQRMARSPRWRWMPGMLVRWPNGDVDRITERTIGIAPGGEPDLTDPATLGAIEHGLLGPVGFWIVFGAHGFAVRDGHGSFAKTYDARADALADAVEAL